MHVCDVQNIVSYYLFYFTKLMMNVLNYKKILVSAVMIVFVGALVAAGTGAFFNDTETSTGNTFASGAIDLTIDSVSHYNGMVCALVGASYYWIPEANVTLDEVNQPVVGEEMDDATEWNAYNLANPAQYPQAGVACTGTWPLSDLGENEVGVGTFFDFDDIKPGDEGENTISIHIDSNDAWMCVALDNVAGTDPSETATEPEDESGDESHGLALTDSELDENLHFFAWLDDGDNIFEEGENDFGDPVSASSLVNQTWALADSSTGNGPVEGGETQYIGVYWCAGDISVVGNTLSCDGEEMGNNAQTDSWSSDLSFYVEQSRNNENFLCNPREPEPIVTTLSLEKVIQQDQTDPVTEAAWTLTADGVSQDLIGSEGQPAVTNVPVVAGIYTLTESALTGFTQTDLQCTGATSLVGNVVTIADGQNVTCTFFNTENTLLPPPPSTEA